MSTPSAASPPLSPPPRLRQPALLQTRRFLADPFELLSDAHARLGPVFAVPLLGLGTWVFVGRPDLVKEMFKAPPDVLAAGEINRQQLGFLLGENATFCLDGKAHDRRRRVVLPFLNGSGAKSRVPLIAARGIDAIEAIEAGDRLRIQPWAHHLSLHILMHVFFGDAPRDEVDRLEAAFERFASRGLRSPLVMLPFLQRDLGPWSPWGRVLAWRRQVVDAVRAQIRARLARPDDYDDVAARLAQATTLDGDALDEDALVDETINDLFAGHETTGNILAWCVECLWTHSDVLARARAEIDMTVGDRPIEVEDLARLDYLQAVIDETTRYRPIAPMAGLRLAKERYSLGGYSIEAGTVLAQCFPVMGHLEDLYERPSAFDPAHFHGRKLPPYHWNPFGGGRRQCLGKGLAEVELLVLLAEMLRRLDLRIAQDSVRPVRDGVFFSPNRGLEVEILSRHAPKAAASARDSGPNAAPASGCPHHTVGAPPA
ncbi:MAG: cytochrome P450 [Acidobacteriota bacterium]